MIELTEEELQEQEVMNFEEEVYSWITKLDNDNNKLSVAINKLIVNLQDIQISIVKTNTETIKHLDYINNDIKQNIKNSVDEQFINIEQRIASSINQVKKEFVKDDTISSSSNSLSEDDLQDLEEYNKEMIIEKIALNNKKMQMKFISFFILNIITTSTIIYFTKYL
jgi:glutamate-1-semialdehyde aminotransferase